MQRYPAVNFRNLEKLSEADLKQLSEDMELINLIEEVEDAEQSTDGIFTMSWFTRQQEERHMWCAVF